ncbi:MAG TPA: LytR C-terminal domain-containing protein [Acidimicrobiales bacterium]|jgi:hypothetical protein|nr:LytR C-terminal domain-containing protein [Acidimicrobiales bacterium]
MSPGRHAADDGSFNRSAGMAAGRGAALLAVAVLLGILLLSATDDEPTDVSVGPGVTEPDDSVTSTTLDEFPTTTITTLAARAPAEVKVLTLNATDVRGAAGRANDVVKAAGFNVLAPADGTRGSPTAVFYTPTYEQEALAVASTLSLAGTSVQPVGTTPPVADLRGANVVVVVGADLAGRLVTTTSTTRATGGAASTATTRATTSTTGG